MITNWMLMSDLAGGRAWSRNVPHSVKKPLENRVWYHCGQSSARSLGTSSGRQPAKIARVLDDGTTQLTQMTSFDLVSQRVFAGLNNLGMSAWTANFRAFDVGASRWLSRDPLSFEGGINDYVYGANNPVRFVDPPGLKPFPGFNYCGPGNNVGEPTNDVDRACRRHDQCYGEAGVEGVGGLTGGGGTTKACELDRCDMNLCSETLDATPRLQNAWNRFISAGVMLVFCARWRTPPAPPRPPMPNCMMTANGKVFCYNPL